MVNARLTDDIAITYITVGVSRERTNNTSYQYSGTGHLQGFEGINNVNFACEVSRAKTYTIAD